VLEDGRQVDTWREGYPTRADVRDEYEVLKRNLQIELLKLQNWMKESSERLIIVFEGRDAAARAAPSSASWNTQPPRGAGVALERPSERETTEWYFQRYVQHLPAAGEIVLFDRSWYNRAGVENVMGFCTEDQYKRFMRQAPLFERMLVNDGIHLVKLWFRCRRGAAHPVPDPPDRSGSPLEALPHRPRLAHPLGRVHRGERGDVLLHRHARVALDVVKSNDKRRGRLEAMRYVLTQFDYPGKRPRWWAFPDPLIIGAARNLSERDEDPDRRFPPL